MHLQMLRKEVAQRMVLFLHQKVRGVCHACIWLEAVHQPRGSQHGQGREPTGKRRLGNLLLAIGEDEQLESRQTVRDR